MRKNWWKVERAVFTILDNEMLNQTFRMATKTTADAEVQVVDLEMNPAAMDALKDIINSNSANLEKFFNKDGKLQNEKLKDDYIIQTKLQKRRKFYKKLSALVFLFIESSSSTILIISSFFLPGRSAARVSIWLTGIGTLFSAIAIFSAPTSEDAFVCVIIFLFAFTSLAIGIYVRSLITTPSKHAMQKYMKPKLHLLVV